MPDEGDGARRERNQAPHYSGRCEAAGAAANGERKPLKRPRTGAQSTY